MNFVLSAIAPETIVAAVAQNTKLNTNNDQSVFAKSNSGPFKIGNHPIKPCPASLPQSNAYPTNKNATVPKQKSIKFFIMMFPAFFARVNPASTIAKPACMKNTNAAPIKYQIANISLSIFSFPPLGMTTL